jgi:hypothetical protein
MIVNKTLAYYITATIKALKGFIVLAPEGEAPALCYGLKAK